MRGEVWVWFLALILGLVLAPLSLGVINRVKAFFGGRRGPRVLQLYFDLHKLFRKGVVYSRTTGGVLQLAPLGGLAATVAALLFMPLGMQSSPLGFSGDMILFFYFLGTARLLAVLGALDTGSAFAGMGASREVQFSALAEVVIFLVVGFLVLLTRGVTLTGSLTGVDLVLWSEHWAGLGLVAGAFFVVLLAENCRVPFDDPETHLELTMIHEAMILDYSGLDLGIILYTASLKLWLLSSFLVMLVLPFEPGVGLAVNLGLHFIGVLVVAVLIGVVESIMARYRFLKVPQMLIGAAAVAASALIFTLIKA